MTEDELNKIRDTTKLLNENDRLRKELVELIGNKNKTIDWQGEEIGRLRAEVADLRRKCNASQLLRIVKLAIIGMREAEELDEGVLLGVDDAKKLNNALNEWETINPDWNLVMPK